MSNTGPNSNLYQIPNVNLGDNFNFWKDVTNTSSYKLNKLKIYIDTNQKAPVANKTDKSRLGYWLSTQKHNYLHRKETQTLFIHLFVCV